MRNMPNVMPVTKWINEETPEKGRTAVDRVGTAGFKIAVDRLRNIASAMGPIETAREEDRMHKEAQKRTGDTSEREFQTVEAFHTLGAFALLKSFQNGLQKELQREGDDDGYRWDKEKVLKDITEQLNVIETIAALQDYTDGDTKNIVANELYRKCLMGAETREEGEDAFYRELANANARRLSEEVSYEKGKFTVRYRQQHNGVVTKETFGVPEEWEKYLDAQLEEAVLQPIEEAAKKASSPEAERLQKELHTSVEHVFRAIHLGAISPKDFSLLQNAIQASQIKQDLRRE